jgi:hypothetical protein
MKFSNRFVIVLACGLAVGFTGMAVPTPVHAAGACVSLKAKFKRKLRPAILRLAKREFLLSNWYHVTLKKQQSGKHPTLADINAVHKAMLGKCNGRSDKASCRKFAKQMTAASRGIFNVNKRWSDAGCPGLLNK